MVNYLAVQVLILILENRLLQPENADLEKHKPRIANTPLNPKVQTAVIMDAKRDGP